MRTRALERSDASPVRAADMESVVALLQHEVQRKLGRCMLRLQQYERLLKTVVAGMAVAGPPEQLQVVQDRQAVSLHNRTLGTLVGMFANHHVTTSSTGDEVAANDDVSADGRSSGGPWVNISSTISMSPERYAQTKADLAELVGLRNDLVHHLIEKFDISDEGNCRAASIHLDSCYERIDANFRTLNAWVDGINKCQAQVSTFLQSDAFENAFEHSVNLNGSACWPTSSIVGCLQEAEQACQIDGWVALDTAVKYISKKSRDEVPNRYGCKSWRQVLKRSEQFELRIVTGSKDIKGQAWYRSCVGLVAPE